MTEVAMIILKWLIPAVCGGAVTWAVTYIKLRKKHELLVAICYTVGVALFSAAHIYELISASAIL